LNIQVAYGHAGGGERCHANQHSVNRSAPPSRVMEARNEEHHAQGRNADSLEDTQRTRLEAELVLRVVGVPEKRDAGYEACEIHEAAVGRHGRDRTRRKALSHQEVAGLASDRF
jgi:hypothetical protein